MDKSQDLACWFDDFAVVVAIPQLIEMETACKVKCLDHLQVEVQDEGQDKGGDEI